MVWITGIAIAIITVVEDIFVHQATLWGVPIWIILLISLTILILFGKKLLAIIKIIIKKIMG